MPLPNLKDNRITKQKKFDGSGITPSYFGHFWPFFTTPSQGMEQTTTLFFLDVLWCSNNLMQKIASTTEDPYNTPSIFKIIYLKFFFRNFTHFQCFRQFYIMPGSLTTLTRFRLILTTYLPSIDIFYSINVDNKWKCLDYLPPPLVNVVCEQPLKLFHPFGSEVFV